MDDRKQNNSRVASVITARNEISENQAWWILVPLFGAGILFYAAGVILG